MESTHESETKRLIKACLVVLTSLTYSYLIPSRLPKGRLRLISLLPIITVFTLLPLSFSTFHLSGTASFFISWLANFKLLLFSFDLGPLVHHRRHLLHFISNTCLPIETKTSSKTPKPSSSSSSSSSSLINYSIKALIAALILHLYRYKHHLHESVTMFLYCIHIYCYLEILLAVSAYGARSLLGADLEPQFNEPYMSTSLQDFWGRRWNLMISRVLRLTVYIPLLRSFPSAAWAAPVASMATFCVSGAMHELYLFHNTRATPTGEIMCFFVLHGVCLVAERWVKRKLGWRLWPFVAAPVTVGFVIMTASWLFLPPFLRNGADVKAIQEYADVARYARQAFKLQN